MNAKQVTTTLIRVFFLTILTCIGLTGHLQADDSCKEIFSVEPQNKNLGGTFYLSDEGSHEISGYLLRGSLLKLEKMSGAAITKDIDNQSGDIVTHYKFIGADGSHGFIRQSDVQQLNIKFEDRASNVSCKNPDEFLVIPANFKNEVMLFRYPRQELKKPPRVNTFSRTHFFPVITSGEIKKIKFEKDNGQIVTKKYYSAVFFQDGGDHYKKRSVLLDEYDETRTYYLIPLDPETYRPIINDEGSFADRALRYIRRILDRGNQDELVNILGKQCNQELSFVGSFKAESPSILPISVGVTAEVTITIPQGERFSLEKFSGFKAIDTLWIGKKLICDNNEPWYADLITVEGLGRGIGFRIKQNDIISVDKNLFASTQASGLIGKERKSMIALKNPDRRLESFAKLGKFLDTLYFRKANLHPADKLRLKSLLLREIVDYQTINSF